MKVLQFGADVKVLEPKELAKEAREEIGRMMKVYGMEKEGVSRKGAERIEHSDWCKVCGLAEGLLSSLS